MNPLPHRLRLLPCLLLACVLLGFEACGGGKGSGTNPDPTPLPTIQSFTASPNPIPPGGTANLTWSVTGATRIVIDGGVGQVTGTVVPVHPSTSTTYTLTASNGSGERSASTTVTVSPTALNHLVAYDGNLQGDWQEETWGTVPSNLHAPDPGGGTSPVLRVGFGAANGWNAYGLANRKDWNHITWMYFNEMRTVEFDVWFEPGCSGVENLQFILEDAGLAQAPRLVDLIPGWANLSAGQRYGCWLHATAKLADLKPTIARFSRFLLFNAADGAGSRPGFWLRQVQVGWMDDPVPPTVTLGTPGINPTYTQLTLPFSTDKAATYRVEYGLGNYSQTIQAPVDTWETQHSVTLSGLTPGSTYQFRITAWAHRTNLQATPAPGTASGNQAMPGLPTAPPVISGLAASGTTGTRTALNWQTDRPCSASVRYQRTGGTPMTRTLSDLSAQRSLMLDLLEPGTAYSAQLTVTDAFAMSSSAALEFSTGAGGAPSVIITADPAHTRPISPWIYGINFYHAIPEAPRNLTLNRQGGNRWTAYNWENNASNAGSDWGPYSNDAYLGGGETPAEAVRSVIEGDRARGNASLMTVQLQGYVAADKAGNVNPSDPNHLATRFKQVQFRKGSAFTASPSTSDPNVYLDEFLWVLRGRFTGVDIFGAAEPLPTFVSLDNEPELWNDTHLEIQGTSLPTPDAYIQRSIEACKALKDLAPGLKITGPVHYGFNGIVNWQGAPGFTDTFWFTDKYLQDLKAASDSAGRRLLDAYDLHWYSEARVNGTRITSLTGTSLTPEEVQAIAQSPRSFWDPSYRENSWIADWLGGPVRLLPRLQAKIDATWPGTALAITEYDHGGDQHIAGALAQADTLGIFGQQGVLLATFWPMSDHYPYILAAFRMFRDYDGQLGSFGDVSIPTTSSDIAKVSVHASRDSQHPGRYVLVAVNRSTQDQDVGFSGLGGIAGTARVYRLDSEHASPYFAGEVPANLGNWVITLPGLSVSTLEIR